MVLVRAQPYGFRAKGAGTLRMTTLGQNAMRRRPALMFLLSLSLSED
jgi:hypothetical protein